GTCGSRVALWRPWRVAAAAPATPPSFALAKDEAVPSREIPQESRAGRDALGDPDVPSRNLIDQPEGELVESETDQAHEKHQNDLVPHGKPNAGGKDHP